MLKEDWCKPVGSTESTMWAEISRQLGESSGGFEELETGEKALRRGCEDQLPDFGVAFSMFRALGCRQLETLE